MYTTLHGITPQKMAVVIVTAMTKSQYAIPVIQLIKPYAINQTTNKIYSHPHPQRTPFCRHIRCNSNRTPAVLFAARQVVSHRDE